MKTIFETVLLCIGALGLCHTSVDLHAAEDADRVRAVVAPSFQGLREQNVRRMDSKLSLNLLVKTLSVTRDEGIQAALLRGMLSGMEGRRNVAEPKGWPKVSARLSTGSHSEVGKLTQKLSQLFGDQAATQKTLATVRDPSAPANDRRSAMSALVTQRTPELRGILEVLLDDSALQVDAIRAYSTLADEQAPALLLARYPSLNFQAKRAVIETLATRKNYANALLAAIADQTVPRAEVPAYIARALSALLGEGFTVVYGDIQALSQDKAKLVSKYQTLLTPQRLAQADAREGRDIFAAVCAACHQLYGEGGKIGPDLTGSNRANIDYIVLNMIDPSADIPDAYRQITIETADGQMLVGTLAEEDDQRLVLNMVGQKPTLLKSDITRRTVSPLSMMPEELLPLLEDSQVLDLVKYLQTTKQVDLPQ
jgi:putative heme-binding domain-containing protein